MRIGEIIESSTQGFTAGSYALLQAPVFGALVQAHTPATDVRVFALVYDVRTQSREPGGRAVLRGRSYAGKELHNEEIYQAHPDLSEVLQTEFMALTVGYRQGERIYQRLPAAPPPVHYSVEPCTAADLRAFGASFGYMRMVLQSPQVPSDELIAATIRHIAEAHDAEARAYALRASRELIAMMRDDFERLRQIVARIRDLT